MRTCDMTDIQKRLFSAADREYAEFQAKLAPTVDKNTFIGVRLPVLRGIAREFAREDGCAGFLDTLPHEYYDENLLHAILLCNTKKYDECLPLVERFLPYVDNWAVCDSLRPNVFKKHRNELLPNALRWMKSDKTYTCRFGVDMMMTHFLDEDFSPEYLDAVAGCTSDEYYVKMMVAWYFATALAKQWDAAVPYIEKHVLADWTHRKAIQKACESFRVSDGHKEYLKTLRLSDFSKPF